MKNTLVIGASTDPSRYSHLAMLKLRKFGHEVIGLGNKPGVVGDVTIETERKLFQHIDTITLYINPAIQAGYADYILSLTPRRVIFNPGTENPELEAKLQKAGIQTEEACTLVLLSTGAY